LASEIDEEIVEQLKRSKEILGEIIPIIMDSEGNILSGRHRERAGWALKHIADIEKMAQKLKVSTSMARDIIRLHLNVQRKPSKEETKAILLRMAKELEAKGIEKKNIASELTKYAPYTDRYIREILPDEYKHKEMAREIAELVPQKATAPVITEGRTAEETITRYPPEEKVYPRASAPRATEFRKPTDTEAEQLLIAELSRRGVNFLTQVPYVRESVDEIPKTYNVDILVGGNLAIEVEGEGSSSANNKERDDFFRSKGIRVFHIPNDCVMKYADLIADLIAYIWAISKG
jgi:very-short-patch-repair endonuclease/chorismate mutase